MEHLWAWTRLIGIIVCGTASIGIFLYIWYKEDFAEEEPRPITVSAEVMLAEDRQRLQAAQAEWRKRHYLTQDDLALINWWAETYPKVYEQIRREIEEAGLEVWDYTEYEDQYEEAIDYWQ